MDVKVLLQTYNVQLLLSFKNQNVQIGTASVFMNIVRDKLAYFPDSIQTIKGGNEEGTDGRNQHYFNFL